MPKTLRDMLKIIKDDGWYEVNSGKDISRRIEDSILEQAGLK